MRILHTMLRVGDLERAIDFYSNHGRRSLDKASYLRAYGFRRRYRRRCAMSSSGRTACGRTSISKPLSASPALWVVPEERQPAYLSTERVVPLGQLWLLFNSTHSRRSLATTLSRRLPRYGVKLKVDPLQIILAGRQRLARREGHEALLALLAEHGLAFSDMPVIFNLEEE